jgi:hypothetical protein
LSLQKTKDIEIEGRRFQIGLVRSDIGSWAMFNITSGKAGDADVFQRLRSSMLDTCKVWVDVEGGAPVLLKIYHPGKTDTWLVPDLELDYNTELVTRLVEEVFEFNFGSFLEKLKKEREEREAERLKKISTTPQ